MRKKKKRLHEVMPPCYTIHYGQAKQDILNVTLDDGKIIYPSLTKTKMYKEAV